MPLIYCVVFGVLHFSRYPTICSLALGFVCVCVDGEMEAILEGTYTCTHAMERKLHWYGKSSGMGD